MHVDSVPDAKRMYIVETTYKSLRFRVLSLQKMQVGQDLCDAIATVDGGDVLRDASHQIVEQVLLRQVEHRKCVVGS